MSDRSTWKDKRQRITPERGAPPLFPLYPYQRRVIQDQTRLIGWIKSRQAGGSVGGTLTAVLDMVGRNASWNAMSRTGRQAKRLLEKAATHVRAIDEFVMKRLNQSSIVERITTQEIVLKSGCSFRAMPCDPDTTVGDTANWLLDEWALYPNSERSFAIIKPSIMRGMRLLGVTTPRGRNNKPAELAERFLREGPDCGWSFHFTTIEQAIKEGLEIQDHKGRVITFEEFRKQEIADMGRDLFMQEYMCSFSDASSAFLSYEDLKSCLVDAPLRLLPEQLRMARHLGRRLGAGFDVGRKRDLSVFVIVSRGPDGDWRTETIIPMDRTKFELQRQIVESYMDTGLIDYLNVDEQGVGMQICEQLSDKYPGQVRPISFTNTNKQVMAERVRAIIQSGNIRIISTEEIEDDFLSIQKVTTEAGNVRLESVGNDTHGDYFWGTCLAVDSIAANNGPVEIAIGSARLLRRAS